MQHLIENLRNHNVYYLINFIILILYLNVKNYITFSVNFHMRVARHPTTPL